MDDATIIRPMETRLIQIPEKHVNIGLGDQQCMLLSLAIYVAT